VAWVWDGGIRKVNFWFKGKVREVGWFGGFLRRRIGVAGE
jgi:hypothetical protein